MQIKNKINKFKQVLSLFQDLAYKLSALNTAKKLGILKHKPSLKTKPKPIIILVILLVSWSSGNAFFSRAGVLRFKFCLGEIRHSVINDLPSL